MKGIQHYCVIGTSDFKSSSMTMIILVSQAHKVSQSWPIETGMHYQAQTYIAYM